MTDLCYLAASEALRLFSERKLSPVELLSALIARTEKVEPGLNAFTQQYVGEAMEGARIAEAKYMSGEPARPLEGLPVAIKEDKSVAGKRTTAGSVVFRDNIASADALPVHRIREAGAIIHARTNVPEMGLAGITGGRLYPPTHNPWNPRFNSGGTSGGAAAALAAGMTTLANASDYCGSIRIPAACCGVVGYKPPRGRNAVTPYFNLDWYDHDGPMARTVADCALLQNAMSGQHPDDLFSLRDVIKLSGRPSGIGGWRIAFSLDLGFVEIDPEVADITRSAMSVFESLGAKVEEVEVGWTEETLEAYRTHSALTVGAWAAQYLREHESEMTNYAIAIAKTAEGVTAAQFLRSLEVEADMWKKLSGIFRQFDVLVCPTLALPAVPLGHDPIDPGFRVNGREVPADFGWMLTYPFNMLSPLPVISVPAGIAHNGVPTSIQIVGRPYEDESVFAAAESFEQANPQFNAQNCRPSL